MPSLLLVVFTLQLLLHIINTVGASTVNELLWILYNKLPTPTSGSAKKVQALKKEVVRLKRELGNTSPQDNFSKWAKLDRQHNKAMAEYQKLEGSLRTHQATFTSAVSTLRWVGTQGLRFVLQFWFAKSPMFWLPAGWVPYYVEWILSFPRAPLGSVSINVWGVACASMIALTAEALAAAWVLVTKQPMPVTAEKQREKEDAMAFKANQRPAEKKEL
ncbi:CHD5-domain-containing protein [Cucurbitaria berberidis CBS 394.84]|uniref:CHD5-domain-containing protein n=1 Tax=Cucurbitaria berberidis CBS 394.84 TaxID=1168544 RepID=A0A9P4GQS8_9PLEO|nr:CHD5-domain-containing protein [Cucurbitaria berberidis CBS 394.84]KAF1849824.1 CHD5-domain-containing protein [Cucurbitaria berberidis CBS 394.84]